MWGSLGALRDAGVPTSMHLYQEAEQRMNDTKTSSSDAADVFISYSSEDRDKIDPIVQLVRALKKDSVFVDFISIRPGEKWADEIIKALEHCQTVLVFWCEHSAVSDWVRQEYEEGIRANKEIIPILLDDTEVPDPLRAYQWLDFRRNEPHGGLLSFVPRLFRRSNRHYYPFDKEGNIRDWDAEDFYELEHNRKREWEVSQATRTEEIARHIAARLTRSRRIGAR
jgi:TIR domain